MLGLLGLGSQAQRYLETTDPDERFVLEALIDAGLKAVAILQRNQAVMIVDEYAKAQRP